MPTYDYTIPEYLQENTNAYERAEALADQIREDMWIASDWFRPIGGTMTAVNSNQPIPFICIDDNLDVDLCYGDPASENPIQDILSNNDYAFVMNKKEAKALYTKLQKHFKSIGGMNDA